MDLFSEQTHHPFEEHSQGKNAVYYSFSSCMKDNPDSYISRCTIKGLNKNSKILLIIKDRKFYGVNSMTM